ncbi:MAG: AAA family ATPase [Clostridiales bacterium]|nr:AAA family ATPase [Clostridiales bacterium]
MRNLSGVPDKKLDGMILTTDQKAVMEAAGTGHNVCILGSPGTGKTTVIAELVKRCKKEGKNVVICTPTAAAASLVNGLTIHRAFGFPARPLITPKQKKPMERTTKALRSADVVIIDEISMVRVEQFEAVVASLKKAAISAGREEIKDIQIIVSGDFYQLPPVITKADREILEAYYGREITYGFAFDSNVWNGCNFDYVMLRKVVRQEDAEFIRNLDLLRIGDLRCIPYFNTYSSAERKEDAISLFPYRWQADAENRRRLKEVSGREYIVRAEYSGEASAQDLAGVEDELHIKEGAKIVFTANDQNGACLDLLYPVRKQRKWESLYVNGSIGVIHSISADEDGKVESMEIYAGGYWFTLYRQEFRVYDLAVRKGKIGTTTKGSYRQFPIKLAYASTIHKSQGKTYDSAVIDPQGFMPGQLYVVISRCRRIEDIYFTRPIEEKDILVNEEVKAFYQGVEDFQSKK